MVPIAAKASEHPFQDIFAGAFIRQAVAQTRRPRSMGSPSARRAPHRAVHLCRALPKIESGVPDLRPVRACAPENQLSIDAKGRILFTGPRAGGATLTQLGA